MEFAAVNGPKSTAKTVAITLTNEEARNPANAFSALLNLGSHLRFKADNGLSQAEGQWLRAQPKREPELSPKPKPELDAKPKDSAKADEKPQVSEKDDSTASNKTDASEQTSANDNKGVKTSSETSPTEKSSAIGLEALQAVAIQFQIFVEQPNGSLQDMGTFDLKSLLAAASQDANLASALESAFGQAAASLSADNSLQNLATQNVGVDPALAANLKNAGATDLQDLDTGVVADLFKQIASAFHPLAQQASATAKAATEATPLAQAAVNNVEEVKSPLETQTPEAARQSAELSKVFGDDNKIRIQVAVNGTKLADVPFEWSPFNRYVGYNGDAARSAATAANQGQGQPGTPNLDMPSPQVGAIAGASTPQSNLGSQQNAGNGMPRSEMAQVRAPDAPTQPATNSNSSQNQSTSFANALNQTNGNSATTQTASAERPAPTQSQQVIDQIKVNITRAAKAGMDRLTIQLRPEELGRIDIKLEMTDDGQVRATVTADKPATLELLQREARGLERALQDAGLNADAGDLEFNLRSQDNDRLDAQHEHRGPAGQPGVAANEPILADNENDAAFDYERAALMRGGVDTYA